MNNVFGRLPFQLAQGAAQSGRMAIVKIQWYKPTTAGDSVLIQDGSGNQILADIAAQNGVSQWYDFSAFPIDVNGVGVGQLTSGKIWIYAA